MILKCGKRMGDISEKWNTENEKQHGIFWEKKLLLLLPSSRLAGPTCATPIDCRTANV